MNNVIHILTDARPECLRQAAAWLRSNPSLNDPSKYEVAWARYRPDVEESTGKILTRIATSAARKPKSHRLLLLVPFVAPDEKESIRATLLDLLGRGAGVDWFVPEKVLEDYQAWEGLEGIFRVNGFYDRTEEDLAAEVQDGPQKASARQAQVLGYFNKTQSQPGRSTKIEPPVPEKPLAGHSAIGPFIDYKLLHLFMGSEPQRNHLKETIAALAAQEEKHFTLPADLSPLVMRHHRYGSPVYAGSSLQVEQFKAEILATARSGGNVLIDGETGTGKEAIAYFLHELGPRRTGPFYALNCAGLKETTLQSRLFGHVKGAYTGADTSAPGLVTLADSGTLFLDELPDMPQTVQAELLRFLQSGEYTPMGSHQTFHAQVRVVAASQPKRLETVRDDLLHRLRHSELRPPALRTLARNQPSDLLTIARNLLTRIKGSPRNAPEGETPYVDQTVVDTVWRELASEPILALLASYDWPGNARELYGLVHRRACRGEDLGRILQEKLGEMHRRGAGPAPEQLMADPGADRPWVWFAPVQDVASIRPLAELEQAYMDHLRTLATTQGMKTAVQQALGLSYEKYLKLLGEDKGKKTRGIVLPPIRTR